MKVRVATGWAWTLAVPESPADMIAYEAYGYLVFLSDREMGGTIEMLEAMEGGEITLNPYGEGEAASLFHNSEEVEIFLEICERVLHDQEAIQPGDDSGQQDQAKEGNEEA